MNALPNAQSTPRVLRWSDVGDFDQLEERVSAVTAVFGNVIGVNDGDIEWCPDDNPPAEQERLAWIWLCNPAVDAEILHRAEGRFRELIVAYRAGDIRRWWDDGGRTSTG